MQLGPATAPTPPTDLAAGLATCAAERGQRPAVTVLSPAGRAEQGFVTLAQWAAKGAHLLQVDLGLVPGDRVLVDVPPGWTLAAVCAAVWWVGGTVVLGDAAGTAGAVVHESRSLPEAPEVYVVGDALDGGITAPSSAYVWAEEVQAFPDQPPTRAAAAHLVAIEQDGVATTHGDLIAALAAGRGVLGVDLAHFTGAGVREVAARPLVTGRATVVLRDLDRSAADGDNVTTWA